MPKNKPLADEETATAGIRRAGATGATAVSLSALKEQADGLRRAQLMANLAHVITGPDGSFESWSETLPGLLGIKDEDIATSTRRWLDLIHPEDRDLFRSTALRARSDRRRAEIEYR